MSHLIDTQSVSVNRDHLYTIIKKFREAFPDNFELCGLEICSTCEGTGIPCKSNQQDITFWQPDNYCTNCKGFGVIGITRIYDDYLCEGCKGSGCKMCGDKGTIDWIMNVVKR